MLVSILVILEVDIKRVTRRCLSMNGYGVSILVILEVDIKLSFAFIPNPAASVFQSLLFWKLILN